MNTTTNTNDNTGRSHMNELNDTQPDQTPPPTAAPSTSWFKAYRNSDAWELWKANRCAFFLLYAIADRAQWSTKFNKHNLAPGEALLGDIDKLGMSAREYRTAKQNLQKWRFATFKTTNAGTIAKLTHTGIFSVLGNEIDKQNDKRPTNDRQTPDNYL